MMYLIVDSASLHNPTVLNEFEQVKVVVSHEPNSEVSKYHYNFLLQIEEIDRKLFFSKIQESMMDGWYFFGWTDNQIWITFNNNIFEMNFNDWAKSNIYLQAQQFGRETGITEEYLDFKKYFEKARG